MVDIHELGALLALYLYLLAHADHKVVAVNALQRAAHLDTVGIEHLDLFANEVDVLLGNLEGLAQAG